MIHALHGNLGSPGDWDALELPGLVADDLWSDLEAEPDLTLEGWGERFAASVEDPEPTLLGYSMGGRLALHAMSAAPEKWAGAIIVSAHPGLPDVKERDDRATRDQSRAAAVRDQRWDDFLADWNAQSVLAEGRPSPDQAALESRREAIARSFENWSLGRQQPLGEKLAACHFPTLWVTGERDLKFTALAAEMENVLPDFEHMIIPDCGHRVPSEKPVELAAAIRDFQKRRL